MAALTVEEQGKLSALTLLLEMTDYEDWYLLHQQVNAEVQQGIVSPEFVGAYKSCVYSIHSKLQPTPHSPTPERT